MFLYFIFPNFIMKKCNFTSTSSTVFNTTSSRPSKSAEGGRSGMKKILSSFALLSVVLFTGCGGSAPMTEEEQAASYGLTVERFREEQAAAARMNMDWEEHVKMLDTGHDMKNMNHN